MNPLSEQPTLLRHSMGKAAAALAAYEGAKQLYSTASNMYREHMVYTVSISETDHAYADVHEWLLELLPSDRQRALVASTVSRRDTMLLEDDDNPSTPTPVPVKLSFNDRRPKKLTIDGQRVTAVVRRSDTTPEPGRAYAAASASQPMSIEFTARTKAGQMAVIKKLEEIQALRGERKPVLRIVNQWGNWVRRSDLPLRDLESVILPESQKSDLVADLRRFLESEDRYVRLALPWHRGYMLHGPPGTGKTSLVKALANEFKLDLWYVSLGDLKEEASLISLLSEVGPRSILLLEDVDTIELTNDADRVEGTARPTQMSLSSLLNALDGVATPHGLITVMTTNHFEKLDERLVRAGRMDRVEELGFPTATEVSAMYRRFYGVEMPVWESGEAMMGFSQAELSEAFKRCLDDPEAAVKAVHTLAYEGGR